MRVVRDEPFPVGVAIDILGHRPAGASWKYCIPLWSYSGNAGGVSCALRFIAQNDGLDVEVLGGLPRVARGDVYWVHLLLERSGHDSACLRYQTHAQYRSMRSDRVCLSVAPLSRPQNATLRSWYYSGVGFRSWS